VWRDTRLTTVLSHLSRTAKCPTVIPSRFPTPPSFGVRRNLDIPSPLSRRRPISIKAFSFFSRRGCPLFLLGEWLPSLLSPSRTPLVFFVFLVFVFVIFPILSETKTLWSAAPPHCPFPDLPISFAVYNRVYLITPRFLYS